MPDRGPGGADVGRLRSTARRLLSRVVWPGAMPYREASTVVCHEWFAALGGSDRVAARLAEVAEADVVYVFALDPSTTSRLDITSPVVTWRFGTWAAANRRFQRLLPVMPLVWWCLDLSRASRVVTSSHSCVNAVRTPAAHRTCYCHTPMRYAWDWRLEAGRAPRLVRPALPAAAAVLRWADRRWSRRVDTYVANSAFVAGRILRAYGREAAVIHPPVDVDRWRPRDGSGQPARTTYLIAGRLVAYKRADLAVRAAAMADVPLVVAGDGPDLPRLRHMAGPTVSFVVDPDDERLVGLVRDARALLFPGIEDFGILPVEAQACGTPVIARGEGGAIETVLDGVTGMLLATDEAQVWATALTHFDPALLDPAAARRNAERFAADVFEERIRTVLAAAPAGRLGA